MANDKIVGMNASRIRKDFMYKLGVDIAGASTNSSDLKNCEKRNDGSGGSVLGKATLTHEPLNDIIIRHEENGKPKWGLSSLLKSFTAPAEDPDLLSSSCSTVASSVCMETSLKESRKLCFDETVTVCQIPRREEYSRRMKLQLWVPSEEMIRNTQRNAIEFAAEGWDWKCSLEDDEMYRCVETNEMIHPVHIECNQDRRNDA